MLLPIALVVGLSGPGSEAPSLAAPGQGLNASAALPASTCGALGVLSSLVGTCPGVTASPAGVQDVSDTTACNPFLKLFNLCGSSGELGWFLLALAISEAFHLPPPATTTTTSSPTTTTSSSSTTTTSSTSTTTTTSTTQPPTSCSNSAPPIAPPSGSWSCTFDDEFNGTSLDTTKWTPQLTSTSGYTTGSAAEVCYENNPNTISEADGYLNLSVIRTLLPFDCTGPGGVTFATNWQGGMVTSYKLFSQEYGYFQVSAELPDTTTQGLQETLWMYPENETLYGPWPDSGEIDYGEFYSSEANADYPVVHYPGSANDPNASDASGCSVSSASPIDGFNTYALSWTPTTITTYFNGTPCITDTYAPYVTSPDTAPEPFNQPFFLAFTAALGLGGDAPTANTAARATTKLDWVRVWQYGN